MRACSALFALLTVAMMCGSGIAQAGCAERDVAPVPRCLELLSEAYASRSIDAYGELLDEEFVAEDGVHSWDKAMEVEIGRMFFENASDVALSFDDGYETVEVSPGLWRVSNLKSHLKVMDGGKEFNISIPGCEYDIRENQDGSLSILRRLIPRGQ